METTGNGIVAEQKCKRIGGRDPDSLWSDPNMENWKETSRNKEIDGNRRKTQKERMTEQSGRQWRGTEWTEIVIEHTEMVGNRRECHGKAGERWRRSEKIWYMTVSRIGMWGFEVLMRFWKRLKPFKQNLSEGKDECELTFHGLGSFEDRFKAWVLVVPRKDNATLPRRSPANTYRV